MKTMMKTALMSLVLCGSVSLSASAPAQPAPLSVQELTTQLEAAKRENVIRGDGVVWRDIGTAALMGLTAYELVEAYEASKVCTASTPPKILGNTIRLGNPGQCTIKPDEFLKQFTQSHGVFVDSVEVLMCVVGICGMWMAYSGEYPTDTIKRAYRFCKRKLGYEVADQKPAATV